MHTCHKLWTEIFKGDFLKFCEIFTKITLKLPQNSQNTFKLAHLKGCLSQRPPLKAHVCAVLSETSMFTITIWAAAWQNQQSNCVPSEDSDQPGHLPSLIRVFAVRMKKPWVLSYPLSAQRRLWLDWADAQADLSLRWTHTHFVGFVMSWLIYRIRSFRQRALSLVLLKGFPYAYMYAISSLCQSMRSEKFKWDFLPKHLYDFFLRGIFCRNGSKYPNLYFIYGIVINFQSCLALWSPRLGKKASCAFVCSFCTRSLFFASG